jgi:DNA-binding MarR family transcriptional regulator
MQSTEIPNDPLSTFSLNIFRVNGLLMRSGDNMTQSIGQSSARWQVLGRAGYQPQTVAQMARDMGLTRQSVQRIADILAKESLTIYRDNPADRRARFVELTPEGMRILAAINTLSEEWSRHIMAKLDAEQLVEVTGALNRIGNILETTEQPISHRSNRKGE